MLLIVYKKYVSKIILIWTIAILGFANRTTGQTPQKIALTRSKVANSLPVNKSDNPPVQVDLLIDSIQPLSDKGIKFSIRWINRSSKAVIVQNVLNSVHVSIVNFEKAYASKNRRAEIRNRGPHWVLEEQPFEIESVNLNKSRTDAETIKKETTNLPANSVLEANLYIKGVIKFDKTNPASTTNYRAVPFAIPKGEYQFSLRVGVTSAGKESRQFSEFLTIPKSCIIKYGL